MPVNYATPAADQLFPVAGVRLGVAEAEIRKKNRRDLTWLRSMLAARWLACSRRTASARRRCSSAASIWQRAGNPRPGYQHRHRQRGHRRAGSDGAGLLRCGGELLVLPAGAAFSTGVILEPLPVDRLKAGLPPPGPI
jgi:glutamate N-acetyltransferase/amino-acid N-acetyltransferase